MGNARSMYRSIERYHLRTNGKVVRCKRIGRVVYPDKPKKLKLTKHIIDVLSRLGIIKS